MRTHGKDFDKYNIRAQDDNGVRFIRSRIHSVFPEAGDKYKIVYSTEAGSMVEEIFDMVVLSIGLAPNSDAQKLAEKVGIELNRHGFAATDNLSPVCTSKKGIYVCGAFQEPKDIPSSVMVASAAVATATMQLADGRWSQTRTRELPPEIDFTGQDPRIGVWVCNCGINIGGIADVPAVRDYAGTLPYVVHVEDNVFDREHIARVLSAAALGVRFEVTSLEGGAGLQSRLRERQTPAPDLLLLDVELGGGESGIALAREARRHWPQVAIVMRSQFDDARTIMNCLAAGA